jgi:hypothetical protein
LYTAAANVWLKRGYIKRIVPPNEAKDDSFLKKVIAKK